MTKRKIVAAAYDQKAAYDLAMSFARAGLSVEIWNGKVCLQESTAQVSIYNLESFFMHPDEEYTCVKALFRNIPDDTICFMKTDSSLRGNVASELAALRDARGVETLIFVPAFPQGGKFTKSGIQYQKIGGTTSKLLDVAERIRCFSNLNVSFGPLHALKKDFQGVFVVDCTSEPEFNDILRELGACLPTALAGSSAFAGGIAKQIMGSNAGAVLFGSEIAVMQDGKRGILLTDPLNWEERS